MKYKLVLNNKKEILIDENQYKYIIQNIDKKFIQINETLINPSYIILIDVDKEETEYENKEMLEQLSIKSISKEDLSSIKTFQRKNQPVELNKLLQNYKNNKQVWLEIK